jgi:hypothetical protein
MLVPDRGSNETAYLHLDDQASTLILNRSLDGLNGTLQALNGSVLKVSLEKLDPRNITNEPCLWRLY